MADIIKKVIEIKADVQKAAQDIKTLFSDLIDNQKQANEQQEELNNQVKDLGTSAESTEKGVNGIAKGFKGVGLAIKAAGIGILISVMNELKGIFMSSQGVVDGYTTSINFLKVGFNEVKTSITEAGESSKSFGSILKDYVQNALDNIISSAAKITSAWGNLFKGKFKEAWVDVKEAAKDVGDAIIGTEGATQKWLDAASELTQLEKNLERVALQQERIALSYEKQAEQQRQLRDDTDKSIQSRIEANDKLSLILQKQSQAEKAAVQARIGNLQRQNQLLGETEERNNQIYQLGTQLVGIENKIAGQRSEQLTNSVSLKKEQRELNQLIIDGANSREIANKEFNNSLILNNVERLKAERETLNTSYDIELKALQDKKALLEEGTLEYENTNQAILNLNAEFGQKLIKNNLDISNAVFEQDIADFEREEELRQRELDARRTFENAKISIIQEGLSLASVLAGENKTLALATLAIEKGLAAAQVVIEAKRSIAGQVAANSLAAKLVIAKWAPVPGGAVPAAAEIAVNQGILAKGIIATKISAAASLASILGASITGARSIGGGGAPTGGSGGSGGAGGAAASFNIVGQSSTNQLAETIAGRQQQPIQAYVVGSSVTTQQALDRNRIDNATFL
jgi:hypothetical protein